LASGRFFVGLPKLNDGFDGLELNEVAVFHVINGFSGSGVVSVFTEI
jgi:hypothetical protein